MENTFCNQHNHRFSVNIFSSLSFAVFMFLPNLKHLFTFFFCRDVLCTYCIIILGQEECAYAPRSTFFLFEKLLDKYVYIHIIYIYIIFASFYHSDNALPL